MPTALRHALILVLLAVRLIAGAEPAYAKKGSPRIDGLDAPPPARAPHADGEDPTMQDDLDRMRSRRLRREVEERPDPIPYEKKREAALLKDTLTPRERGFLMEVSVLATTVTTSGDRKSYTSEPTSEIFLGWRQEPKRHDGRTGLWYGLRVLPIAGTGFYKKVPGTYGLTYFGPMLGVGRIDPVPEESGQPHASSASGTADIPTAGGWLVTGGIALVSRTSRGEAAGSKDPDSDFTAKGAAFDSPGAWLEGRWLHILWGAAGYDVIVGAQTGRDKVYVYAGIGAAAWY